MKAFLKDVISDLSKRLNGNFNELTIIFPNKRAGLFVNQYLAEMSDKPIWAPRYTTINEFFSSLSDKKVPDTIELVVELYKAYYSSQKKNKTTLERFFGWGEILLNDFQDIDNNLVNAEELFCNISALEELKRLDYLSPEQIEAIKGFFTDFDPDDTNKMRQQFADMWNSMGEIYNTFRNTLSQKGLAYEAMLKREVIETLKDNPADLSGRKFAIVGFNVLSETEKKLFQHLQMEAETYFYWDYNPSFIRHEAASFISENIKLFGSALDHFTFSEQEPKANVEIVAAGSDTAQACFAREWISQFTNGKDTQLNQSAVVLADENLLLPVVQTLPDCTLNITMGYPLRQTPIANLIGSLISLRMRGKAKNGWYHSFVTPILRHPYILQLAHDDAVRIYDQMRKHNEMYPSPKLFACNEFLAYIFNNDESTKLLPYLVSIIKRIGIANKGADSLTIEAIFTTYQIVNRLQVVEELLSTDDLIGRLIGDLINRQNIAFHGEPAIGLQVMGMLETRNLDFRNLIILSANEGTLPKVSHSASFIPYFLRSHHNMTTIEKQTSLYAYYFYRLLQRAENVAIVYNNHTEGLKKGEISRFLLQMQIEQELPICLTNSTLFSSNSAMIKKVEEMEKSADIIERLSKLKRLTPSMLNTYIACPMKFYFSFLANLKAEEGISEEVENSTFGDIIHDVLYNLYHPFVGKQVTESQLVSLSKDDQLIESLVDKSFSKNLFHQETFMPVNYNGEQYLNKIVIIKYIKSQLLYDSKLAPIFIESLENPVECLRSTPNGEITLHGRIDRIDHIQVGGSTVRRIVDYKTSSKQQTTKSTENLFSGSSEHIFQTLCYAEMLSSQNSHPSLQGGAGGRPLPLAPSLNYIKLINKDDYKPTISIGKTTVTDYCDQLQQEFTENLDKLIDEIYNPDVKITQTAENKKCEYCDFRNLCQR